MPGLALVASWGLARTALAGGDDLLFTQQPEHPLIESSQRVSDGRKLQHDADGTLRRAEGGVGGEVSVAGAAVEAGEGSARRVAAGRESERVQAER